MQAFHSIRSVLNSAHWLVPCAMLIGCSRGPTPTPPRAKMALTTVRSAAYTTAVPSGWEIHIPSGNLLEAYDPVAPSVKNTSSLQFVVQPDPGHCGGEKVKTASGDACVVVKYDHEAKIPSTIVEAQTPKHFLRLIHSAATGEKPTEPEEMKELALRILNQSAPPATPLVLARPEASPAPAPAPELNGESATAATH